MFVAAQNIRAENNLKNILVQCQCFKIRTLKSPWCMGFSLAEVIFLLKRYTEKAYTFF